MPSVISKILSLSKWTLATAAVTLALQLVLYYLIAIAVEPTELGNYFLVAALIFIPAGILEYSFVSSLIHSDIINDKDYKSVFVINLKLALAFAMLGVLLAALLSFYYNKPSLLWHHALLLPILLFVGYSSVQNAGLKKNLDIKKFSQIELVSIIVYFIVTLVLLQLGWNIMALIAGQLAKAASSALMLYLKTSYMQLGTQSDRSKSDTHWNYGKYIMGEKSLGIGMSYLDVFLIHHFLGAQVLGIYDLLKRMVLRPLISAYHAIEQVVFPMLSKATEEPVAYRKVYNSLIKLSSIFLLTLAGIFFVEPVLSFFPVAYASYDTVLRLIICLAVSIIIFNPVDIVAYSLDITKRYFNWIMIYSVVQIVAMFVSLCAGLEPFLYTMILFNLVTYVLSFFVLVKGKTSISFIDWAKPVIAFGVVLILVATLRTFL